MKTAFDAEGEDATFLTQLFSVRTGLLAGKLNKCELTSYLSGLVIGNEFRQAKEANCFKSGDKIGIVGNDGLNNKYKQTAKIFKLNVDDGGEEAAVSGALEIYSKMILAAQCPKLAHCCI